MLGMADYLRTPGPQEVREAAETNLLWNKGSLAVFDYGAIIDGTASDAGNSPTSTLRAGLLLGKVASSGKLLQWSPTAVDGSQFVYGVAPFPIKLPDLDGVGRDRALGVLIGGHVKASAIVTATGAITQLARSQMRGRFLFDDDFNAPPSSYFPWRGQVSKTADYVVSASDSGILFDNTGDLDSITFTLPPIASGLVFGFLVVADHTLTVASAAGDDLIVRNDAAADSVSFSIPGDKVGGLLVVYSNPAATKWVCEFRSTNSFAVAT